MRESTNITESNVSNQPHRAAAAVTRQILPVGRKKIFLFSSQTRWQIIAANGLAHTQDSKLFPHNISQVTCIRFARSPFPERLLHSMFLWHREHHWTDSPFKTQPNQNQRESGRTSRKFTMKRSWFPQLQNTINWLFKAQWVTYFCAANYITSQTCIFFKWVKKHQKSEKLNWTKFGRLYTAGVVLIPSLMINES